MPTTLTITTKNKQTFLQGGGTAGGKDKKPRKGSASSRVAGYIRKKMSGGKPVHNSFLGNYQRTSQILFSNQAKRQTKDGTEYLVVPGVPVQEQVMNTYLLPADEIEKWLTAWDGTPVSIRHAQQNNGSVQVDNPDVPIIGHFQNTTWDASGKRMLGEYWINTAEVMKYPEGQLIVSMIENGDVLETSTAYWADEEPKPGSFKGKAYKTVHRNLKPDHIAVFPGDQLGACSIQDGCGVNRNMKHNSGCSCMQHNNTGDLPDEGKALWEKVYEANKSKGAENAAKLAWAACEKAGWAKNDKGDWVKKNSGEAMPEYKAGYLPTALLIGYSLNKGSRTQAQLDSMRAQVQEHGITKPVWVQCNGSIRILDGNHRVALADEFGIDQVPVRVVDSHLQSMDAEAVYRRWMHEQDQEYLA